MKIHRRALLAGLAVAGTRLEAQQTPQAGAPAPGSLYIPKAHLVEDRKFLHDFMDEFSFVDLVPAAPEPRITHIPVFIDRSQGKFGTIYGHVSKQNPQSKMFDGRQNAV